MTRAETRVPMQRKSAWLAGFSKVKRSSLLAILASVGVQAFAGTDGAARYSAQHGERALLIWQNGRLRLERYSAGGSRDKTENVYSITKSLCALGTFSAIGRNVLELDEPVSLTLTEWRSDPRKRRITVRDLLNSTPADLLSIANFGEKTLDEVYRSLEAIGFQRRQTKSRFPR
jgi:DNA-directed RNA polymerase subunit alpha